MLLYKEPSGQKVTLDLLAAIILKVVHFHMYTLFPVVLQFLNASWKSCSMRVFSSACNSASITSFVSKWRPFSSIFNRRNRKVRRVGDNRHIVFYKKFPCEKGTVRGCVVVMQQQFSCHQSSGRIFTQ
jgi:hypothetical protein